jgi:hypothetical protein
MGTNCAPLVANLSIVFCKLMQAHTLSEPHNSLLFWAFRYIDDLFFILISSLQLETLSTVLKDIYASSGLKSVAGGSSDNKVILDIQVSTLQVVQTRLKFGIYKKPDNCYQYLHFNSCINPSIKITVIIFKAWRIVARFDNTSDCAREFAKFSKFLEFHDYPLNFTHNTLEKFLHRVGSQKDDLDYRLILNYCENIDCNHLSRQLSLMDRPKTIQIA